MKRVPTPADELQELADRAASAEKKAHGKVRLREFSRSLPMALLRTREAVMRHFRPGLRQFDITEQQWRVLRALASIVEIDATGLAKVTFLLAPSLTRILKDLEVRELIVRRVDPNDQRAARISLSPNGRSLLDEAGIHSEKVYRAMTARIGEARLETLMALLKEVEVHLEEALVTDGDVVAPLPDEASGEP